MITIEDRDQLIKKLETIKEKLYTTQKASEEILSTEEKSFLDSHYKNYDSDKNINHIIVDLKKIPVVELTLAIMPSIAMMERIQEKLMDSRINELKDPKSVNNQSINPLILLDITIDPAIIGGAIVAVNGNYRDFSVRKNLQ